MTNEQIQIAVAECCGWKKSIEYTRGETWEAWRNRTYPFKSELPNYPEDLNACADMEKALPDHKWYDYYRSLIVIWSKQSDFKQHVHPVQATARQRCEAFLRTLGKWKD